MKILILYFVVFIPIRLVAQDNLGPRLTALGNNSAAIADVWAIQGNPATATSFNEPIASINYIRHFLSDEISTQGFAAVLPIKNNFISIGINRYGLNSYNQNKISLAYAKKFGNQFSLAMTVNYHQLKISNYGSSKGFSVDVGLYYTPNEKFAFGAYLSNPTQQRFINAEISAPIQTTFNVGASYLISDKVLLATTVAKQLEYPIDTKLGLEYQIAKSFALRAGVSAKPFKQYAGFGINLNKILIDFATTFDNNLGYSPQIALGYAF